MGFLSPWFLGGLAALGVPVFVHLLRKHISIPQHVSSLMFFERGTQSSTRHRRFQHLLLFALRLALVALVVFAFADPFIRSPRADVSGHLMLIVLDNSFSMRAGTRFAYAKREVLDLLARRPHAQRAQVVSFGGQVQLLTQPTTDAALLRSALDGIQQSDGYANFGGLASMVRTLSETRPGQIDLHLFSDMQRTGMPANFAEAVLPTNVKLVLHEVAKAEPVPNWVVESIDAPTEVTDPKDNAVSRVRAVIAGPNAPERQKDVSLVINGKVAATRKVNVPANGRATVDFSPLDVNYGFNRCEVRIDDNDVLPADNAGVFAVRRLDPQRVLFVHAALDQRSTTYFGAALHAATHGAFVLQTLTEDQVTDVDPSRFAFTVLSDVNVLPNIFEHTLEQYVAKGGNVFISLGASSSRGTHIPLWDRNAQQVRKHALPANGATVGQVDFTYPALEQENPGRNNGGWDGTKVFYTIAVDSTNARVAARLSDSTPLLLERQMGEGHVLLFASGLDNLTNDLPLHPIFVAFVDKTARYLSGNEQLRGLRVVDSFVQLRQTTSPANGNAAVEVIDPAGHRPLSLNEARTAQSFRLTTAGFYQIRFANGRDAVIGVNPDRRESDLQPLSPDLLALWVGRDVNQSEGERVPVVGSKYQYKSLWRYVMLLALVVAVAEVVIASRYLGTQREET